MEKNISNTKSISLNCQNAIVSASTFRLRLLQSALTHYADFCTRQHRHSQQMWVTWQRRSTQDGGERRRIWGATGIRLLKAALHVTPLLHTFIFLFYAVQDLLWGTWDRNVAVSNGNRPLERIRFVWEFNSIGNTTNYFLNYVPLKLETAGEELGDYCSV